MADKLGFKDYVPEGQDAGPITADGFQDFIPDPKPEVENVEEVKAHEPEEVIIVPKKKLKSLKFR